MEARPAPTLCSRMRKACFNSTRGPRHYYAILNQPTEAVLSYPRQNPNQKGSLSMSPLLFLSVDVTLDYCPSLSRLVPFSNSTFAPHCPPPHTKKWDWNESGWKDWVRKKESFGERLRIEALTFAMYFPPVLNYFCSQWWLNYVLKCQSWRTNCALVF